MINILAKAKQANVVFFNSEKWTQASHFKLQDWLFSLPRFLRLSMQRQVFSSCTPGFLTCLAERDTSESKENFKTQKTLPRNFPSFIDNDYLHARRNFSFDGRDNFLLKPK